MLVRFGHLFGALQRSVLAASLLVALGAGAAAQDNAVRVRGTIVRLEGNVLTVAAGGENRRVTLNEGFKVVSLVKAELSNITPGAFVGSAAVMQPDGTLRAVEVHIFPESLRGSGEGHRPWDLGAQSSMTNGTVDAIAEVESVGGRVLTVKYTDGEKKIVVTKDTAITIYEPADPKAIVAGAHVFINAQRAADGSLSTNRVNVGKNGLIPSM